MSGRKKNFICLSFQNNKVGSLYIEKPQVRKITQEGQNLTVGSFPLPLRIAVSSGGEREMWTASYVAFSTSIFFLRICMDFSCLSGFDAAPILQPTPARPYKIKSMIFHVE